MKYHIHNQPIIEPQIQNIIQQIIHQNIHLSIQHIIIMDTKDINYYYGIQSYNDFYVLEYDQTFFY